MRKLQGRGTLGKYVQAPSGSAWSSQGDSRALQT
jgi:hypothetical protein